MPYTAIVIGATGLIGKELVQCLTSAEHISDVITLTRRPIDHPIERVRNHVVDFDDLASAAHLFEGDYLFSCLGTTVKQAGSVKAQRLVDLHYQYTAAKLASEQGVSHYLLVSSSGANAKSVSPYLKMKGELEQQVEALSFESINIFQPSLLLGQRSEQRTAEGLASKIMPTLTKLPGLSRYRPIHGWQVAQKMTEVSQAPKPGIKRFVLDDVFP